MDDSQTVLTTPRPARLRRSTAVSEYDRRGYLIIPDALSVEMIDAARAEATVICRGLRGQITGVTPAGEEDDAAVLQRYLCIHFPHKISSTMLDIARLPGVIKVLVDLIGPNVKMMQSMLFIKSEESPVRRGTRMRLTSRPETGLSKPCGSRSMTPRSRTVVCGSSQALIAAASCIRYGSRRPSFRLHARGVRVRLPRARCRARGATRRCGAGLRRLSPPPITAQHEPVRHAAGSGQSLHERGITPAVVPVLRA